MQYNPDYPWYLQKSENFTKLYDGIYDTVSQVSSLDIWKLFYVNELTDANLHLHALLWGFGTAWSSISDALVYNAGEWSGIDGGTYQNKLWSGKETDIGGIWYRKYLKMKMFLQGKPMNYATLKQAVEILMAQTLYTQSFTEGYMTFTLTIVTDADSVSALNGLLTFDPNLFGKPVGIKPVYTFTTEE